MKRKSWFAIIVILISFLFAGMSFAQTVTKTPTFGWTNPTTNTDGSPLTNQVGVKLYKGSASGGPYTLFDTIADTVTLQKQESLPLTAGVDSTTYWVLTAYTATSESAYSNVISLYYNLAPPGIPGAFTISAFSGSSVTFTWTQAMPSPNDLAGWHLYSSATSGGPWVSLVDATYSGTPASSYTATASVPAGTAGILYFVVASYDTSGNVSTYSAQTSHNFTTVPAVPTGLKLISQ